MGMKRIILSKRLQMLASMVTSGNRVADVGCDHGFLPIWLVQSGTIPGALAMDVREGPLEAAREHVAAYGLEEYISVRISDGLKEYHIGEAETIVCAGMGGRLMEKILTESLDKAKSARELILQPQSELREFRAFLRRSGFSILTEDAVYEDGKYYFAMKAVYGGCGAVPDMLTAAEKETEEVFLYDMFGEKLLLEKHPVLQQYLLYRRDIVKRLKETVSGRNTERTDMRLKEMEEEFILLEKALTYF